MIQIHCYVRGDVIGVGFRVWTKIQAKINHLTGWVRNVFNRPKIFGTNGGVEVVFQGEEKNIKKIKRLIKLGPPTSSYIDKVRIKKEAIDIVFNKFEIKK